MSFPSPLLFLLRGQSQQVNTTQQKKKCCSAVVVAWLCWFSLFACLAALLHFFRVFRKKTEQRVRRSVGLAVWVGEFGCFGIGGEIDIGMLYMLCVVRMEKNNRTHNSNTAEGMIFRGRRRQRRGKRGEERENVQEEADDDERRRKEKC